jgi:hypothetical protein
MLSRPAAWTRRSRFALAVCAAAVAALLVGARPALADGNMYFKTKGASAVVSWWHIGSASDQRIGWSAALKDKKGDGGHANLYVHTSAGWRRAAQAYGGRKTIVRPRIESGPVYFMVCGYKGSRKLGCTMHWRHVR